MEQFGIAYARRREELRVSRREIDKRGGGNHTNLMRIEAGVSAPMRAAYKMLRALPEMPVAERQRMLDENLANRIADEVERWAIYRWLLDAPADWLASLAAELGDPEEETPEEIMARIAEQALPASERHMVASQLARQIHYHIATGTLSAAITPDVDAAGASLEAGEVGR